MITSAIEEFDQYLNDKSLKFEAIIIGGAALSILHIITRMTEDVDCIDPVIPDEIKKASAEFIKLNPKHGLNPEKFLNNGPISIIETLPDGWKGRTQLIFQGKALTFFTLGRIDLLKTKLDAMVHRGRDMEDVVAMKPTEAELVECKEWVLNADGGEHWPEMVKESFDELRSKLNGNS
ncbi:MAG: hypothetical protein H7281_15310 [Bacteriovorax sp.]|nr:hypothetical protein [Bacteriovorax sp.]